MFESKAKKRLMTECSDLLDELSRKISQCVADEKAQDRDEIFQKIANFRQATRRSMKTMPAKVLKQTKAQIENFLHMVNTTSSISEESLDQVIRSVTSLSVSNGGVKMALAQKQFEELISSLQSGAMQITITDTEIIKSIRALLIKYEYEYIARCNDKTFNAEQALESIKTAVIQAYTLVEVEMAVRSAIQKNAVAGIMSAPEVDTLYNTKFKGIKSFVDGADMLEQSFARLEGLCNPELRNIDTMLTSVEAEMRPLMQKLMALNNDPTKLSREERNKFAALKSLRQRLLEEEKSVNAQIKAFRKQRDLARQLAGYFKKFFAQGLSVKSDLMMKQLDNLLKGNLRDIVAVNRLSEIFRTFEEIQEKNRESGLFAGDFHLDEDTGLDDLKLSDEEMWELGADAVPTAQTIDDIDLPPLDADPEKTSVGQTKL